MGVLVNFLPQQKISELLADVFLDKDEFGLLIDLLTYPEMFLNHIAVEYLVRIEH